MPVERRRVMDVLHIGPIVTINPWQFFPCSERNMRHLLFMAGEDREKVREEVRACLEELIRIRPEYEEQYRGNLKMLEEIE